MKTKILPDQSESSSHGRFHDEQTHCEKGFIFFCSQSEYTANSGHHQCEDQDYWLPSNDVHQESVN